MRRGEHEEATGNHTVYRLYRFPVNINPCSPALRTRDRLQSHALARGSRGSSEMEHVTPEQDRRSRSRRILRVLANLAASARQRNEPRVIYFR